MDTRTTLIIMAIGCLIVAAALFVTHAGRFRRDGLRLWTVGYIVQGVAWGLFAFRGIIPDFLSVVVGNVLHATAYSLVYAAVREFQGKPYRWRLQLVPAIVTFLFFIANLDSQAMRAAFSGLLFSVQVGAIAWVLFRDAPSLQRRSSWLTGIAFLLGAALWLLRFLEVLVSPPDQLPLLTSSLMRTGSVTAGVCVVIMSSFGFLLMTRERADYENERLATLDSLTEIFNRRTFLDLAEKEIAGHHRHGRPLALLMVDFDDFKQVNDTYGHLIGDAVLKAFTMATRASLRRMDLFGRYGGEEFAILLPETDAGGAAVFAERLRALIADSAVPAGNASVSCTISIGITNLDLEKRLDLEALLRIADKALYAAKNGGRNRVVQLSASGNAA